MSLAESVQNKHADLNVATLKKIYTSEKSKNGNKETGLSKKCQSQCEK